MSFPGDGVIVQSRNLGETWTGCSHNHQILLKLCFRTSFFGSPGIPIQGENNNRPEHLDPSSWKIRDAIYDGHPLSVQEACIVAKYKTTSPAFIV